MQNEVAQELRVIDVDTTACVVKVASTANDLQDRLYQLQSEDATTLAINALQKAGIPDVKLRTTTVLYGDDATGVPAKSVMPGSDAKPFLVVEMVGGSPGLSYTGDSNLRR